MVIRSDCMLLHWNEFARILLDFDKVIIVVDDKEKKYGRQSRKTEN